MSVRCPPSPRKAVELMLDETVVADARALGLDLDREDPGGTLDDLRQVLGAVVLESVRDAEAVA